jgi:hypothetical protein
VPGTLGNCVTGHKDNAVMVIKINNVMSSQ